MNKECLSSSAERKVQYSIMLVKPNFCTDGGCQKVKEAIVEAGLEIIYGGHLELSPEKVTVLYRNTKVNVKDIVDYLCCGQSYAILVRSPNAVLDLLDLRGNTALGARKASGLRGLYSKNPHENSIHAPSSSEEAKSNIPIILGNIYLDILNFTRIGDELYLFVNS